LLSKPQPLNSPLDQRAEGRGASLGSGVSLQFQRGVNGWRDPLRRRMLALSDVLALVAGSVALGIPFDRNVERTMWALAILPLWIVSAKLYGLYDRDHIALRAPYGR